MKTPTKHNILGVKIDSTDYQTSVDTIVDAAKNRKTLGVSALAVHGVMTGVLDNEHRYRLNQLELVVPDGQPVRWALNAIHKTGLNDRVYGPNLMLKTCEAAAANGISIFLFGGKEELLERLQAGLLKKFPSLKFAGVIPSKFRCLDQKEKSDVIEAIKTSGAGITFVGLGCPRQEVWAYEFKDHLQMPVIAVGAAFNFHAGLLPQAPKLLQDFGLEWLYRFWKEPRRLWHRYLYLNPYYMSLIAMQWIGLKSFDPESTTAPNEEILYG